MKIIIVLTTMVISACSTVPPTQEQRMPPTQEQSAADIAPASDGLRDLDAMTFDCPKAGLNAAAREARADTGREPAARFPSQGHYQFSYFKIISDSQHSFYEVHFKSNYSGEPDLKYCVSVYCQQGWDANSKTSVSLIGSGPQPSGASAVGAAHRADCGDQQTRVKRRLKR
jgi:hypothetical protein